LHLNTEGFESIGFDIPLYASLPANWLEEWLYAWASCFALSVSSETRFLGNVDAAL